jgi:HK97 family phage portal protein
MVTEATWTEALQRSQRGRAKGAGELIPTWNVGMPQPHPNNLELFAREGYSKNSLIYACIREIASSFATLNPVLIRANDQRVKRHRMLDLIENPNTYQDRFAFFDVLTTQFEAAGNVYIEKVRRSTNDQRRRDFTGYPVQELQLIRPDYVMIQPGSQRAADVFVVTIGGQERRRLARADVIHIHDPNLINDFYGLSKIALLTREGSIDLEMSDFELSFFRNAGVPMGLLNVKGRNLTQDQVKEVKSKFREAYNGVRHWFDLLVLNSDEASFTQLGLPPNQMEGDATRFHVESRICAVFGVPPVIVGARLAYQSAASLNYEQAQFQFWSETIVPLARTIGGAFERFLLPEFALIADTGARFTYDFTEVRALQEDRSRKLREVVRLVLTGGFTINEALTIVGLPATATGDFYIRQGNHVVVTMDGEITPMTESPEQSPAAANPLEGAAALSGPVVVKSPRCQKCGKMLARALAVGSEIDCPRCREPLLVGVPS